MQVRINAYRRAPHKGMDLETQLKFYDYFPKLIRASQDEKYAKKVALTPGDVLIVYNWRLLHGRTPFKGQRTLSGCYINHETFLSRSRSLGINNYF